MKSETKMFNKEQKRGDKDTGSNKKSLSPRAPKKKKEVTKVRNN